MAKYKYKQGRIVPKQLDAQTLGDELDRIRVANDGKLTPSDVVEESRPKTAVLHPQFEWRDKVAAEEYRQHQARNLINVVVIEHETSRGIADAQAFVNIVDDDRGYRSVVEVMSDEESRAKLVQRYLERLVRMQREFRMIREFANVCRAIDELAESIGGV